VETLPGDRFLEIEDMPAYEAVWPDHRDIETTERSPVTERVGRYVFWAIVVALLFARAVYPPTSHPGSADTFHEAKKDAVR
jgi:hypothetical protein